MGTWLGIKGTIRELYNCLKGDIQQNKEVRGESSLDSNTFITAFVLFLAVVIVPIIFILDLVLSPFELAFWVFLMAQRKKYSKKRTR